MKFKENQLQGQRSSTQSEGSVSKTHPSTLRLRSSANPDSTLTASESFVIIDDEGI
jgi:hypothetical protein